MVGFPLLLIPLAIFNIIVFLMPGVSFTASVFTLPLMSGVAWTVTVGDLLLAIGVFLLLLEVIKAARPGSKYFTDHLLSLIVFGGAAAEFLLLPAFGTSTYFLLTALAFVDVVSGIALRARRAKRVVMPAAPPTYSRPPEPEPVPPRFDPAPVPPAPAHPVSTAAPVVNRVEPIVMEPPSVPPVPPAPEPTPPATHPEVAANQTSPEVPSPGLQPSHDIRPGPGPDTPPR